MRASGRWFRGRIGEARCGSRLGAGRKQGYWKPTWWREWREAETIIGREARVTHMSWQRGLFDHFCGLDKVPVFVCGQPWWQILSWSIIVVEWLGLFFFGEIVPVQQVNTKAQPCGASFLVSGAAPFPQHPRIPLLSTSSNSPHPKVTIILSSLRLAELCLCLNFS